MAAVVATLAVRAHTVFSRMTITTARVGTLMVFACLTVVFVGNALHYYLIAHNRRPESSK